jgi:rhamnogalacturonan endolyase
VHHVGRIAGMAIVSLGKKGCPAIYTKGQTKPSCTYRTVGTGVFSNFQNEKLRAADSLRLTARSSQLIASLMLRMKRILLLLLCFACIQIRAQLLSVTEEINAVTIANEFISIRFNKANADLTGIRTSKGIDLLGRQGRAYLLGPGFSMSPATYSLLRKTDDLVEIAFEHAADNHFNYKLHYVIRKGVPGVYCFLVQSHKAGDSMAIFGQTRWGIRGDEAIYDYHLVRDSIHGPMPKMAELKEENEIQDWTYRMPDSSVYTKYDYADYIEGRHVHGMAGRQSGQGLFVIQASHEYLNGGPSKQYQNVHSNPYLICMFNCGHFLSDIRKGDDRIGDEWVKLNGPFLLYVNQGVSVDAIWQNAKQQAATEMEQWPYTWMQHPEYPLDRGSVSGRLWVNTNYAKPNSYIILASPGYDWQAQGRSYIYYARTNANGEFSISHVRPGKYTLYAYGSDQTEEFQQPNITVKKGTNVLGDLKWTPRENGRLLWQIGIADRRTKGFRLADHKRNYGVFNNVPAALTYTIGKNNDADWYYAQTKPGKWNIVFNNIEQQGWRANLTIAMAGVAKNPLLEIYVNDQKVASLNKLGNDASVYRSAIAGGYYQQHTIEFDAGLLKQGENTISFSLPNVKPGGGIMYDAIKLEVK